MMRRDRHQAQFLALLRLHQREIGRRRRAEADAARLGRLLDFAVGITLRDRPPSDVRAELAAGALPRGDRFSLRPAPNDNGEEEE